MPSISIPVVFIDPLIGDLGSPPNSVEWIERVKAEVMDGLRRLYPNVDFRVYDIRDVVDIASLLKAEGSAVGYLVIALNSIVGYLDPIVRSGKPVIVIAEAYAGAGEYVLAVSRARAEGYPVLGISTRNLADESVLGKVRYLIALARLRNSKVLFVVAPSTKSHATWQFPLGTDLYSLFRTIQALTGVTPIIMDAEEFRRRFFDNVNLNEAREVLNNWVRGAEAVNDDNEEELLNAAKLYIAMKNAARELSVDAIALDCITLYNTGLLKAWPCLGYMQLWYDGIMPVCEADPYSAIPILISKYLLNRNGFVVNVGMDETRNEYIYHHCYAPTNPHGSEKPEAPYIITKAHLGAKHASIHVKLPTNEPITAMGFDPNNKVLTIQTSKAINNEYSPQACSTKLIAKGSPSNAVRNWVWRSGWHRVIVYGEFVHELTEFAILLGLSTIIEDGS